MTHQTSRRRERNSIRLSAATNLAMAALGIGVGFAAHSEAILLDGVYNAISLVMALLSLKVADLVVRPGDERFPFGYAVFEPLVNLTKSLLVLGVSLLALLGAIAALLAGGRALEPGLGLVYAVIAAAGCLAVGVVQRRAARETGSPLLDVDAKNWLINGAISAAVGLAFGLAWWLEGTSLRGAVPYTDPVLVVVLVLATAPIPLRILWTAFTEVVGVGSPRAVRHDAEARVMAAVGEAAERVMLRVMPVGRFHFVIGYVQLAAGHPIERIAELDVLRTRVESVLGELFPNLACEVVFTGEPGRLA